MYKIFRVIYLYKGDRHIAYSGYDQQYAKEQLHALLVDNWIAWIESN